MRGLILTVWPLTNYGENGKGIGLWNLWFFIIWDLGNLIGGFYEISKRAFDGRDKQLGPSSPR